LPAEHTLEKPMVAQIPVQYVEAEPAGWQVLLNKGMGWKKQL